MSVWIIRRDGQAQSDPYAREEYAFGALLRMQPFSVDHATTHEGWELLRVDSLADYEAPNYLREGTVARQQHDRAKIHASGWDHTVTMLATAAYEVAYRLLSRDGDYLIEREVLAPMLDALQDMPTYADTGYDGGAVASWCDYIRELVGIPQE